MTKPSQYNKIRACFTDIPKTTSISLILSIPKVFPLKSIVASSNSCVCCIGQREEKGKKKNCRETSPPNPQLFFECPMGRRTYSLSIHGHNRSCVLSNSLKVSVRLSTCITGMYQVLAQFS